LDLAEELGFWNPRTVLRLAASDEGGDEGVEVFGADGVVGVAGSDEGVAGDVGDGGVVGRWQRKRYKIGGGVDDKVRLPVTLQPNLTTQYGECAMVWSSQSGAGGWWWLGAAGVGPPGER